jgi:flavin reductase (DIM6/NTAB) family NADH-FMN oxidoreductase RutF
LKKSLGARTLLPTAPVWVIGTYDADGRPNVMTASWGGICCSKPPCVGVSLRAATYSHGAIKARRAFTVSVPSEDQVREADFFGIVSGRDTDKFAASGLTPVRSDLVDAPYVAQCPVVLECRLHLTVEVGLHTQFIGEILDVKVEEGVLDANGLPDPGKVRPFLFCPELQAYHGLGTAIGRGFRVGKELRRPE